MVNNNQASDRELIERAKGNDSNAFCLLHDRYKKRILNYLYRFFGNYSLAEEVAQEAFIRIYENLDKYQPIGTVRGWIYTIAANLAKNKLRDLSKKKEISLDMRLSAEDESFTLADIIKDKAPGPDKIVEDRGESLKVQESIAKMEEKYKQVIILCGIQGLSYDEAAEVIGCSIKVVGVRLMRARQKLKSMLKES